MDVLESPRGRRPNWFPANRRTLENHRCTHSLQPGQWFTGKHATSFLVDSPQDTRSYVCRPVRNAARWCPAHDRVSHFPFTGATLPRVLEMKHAEVNGDSTSFGRHTSYPWTTNFSSIPVNTNLSHSRSQACKYYASRWQIVASRRAISDLENRKPPFEWKILPADNIDCRASGEKRSLKLVRLDPCARDTTMCISFVPSPPLLICGLRFVSADEWNR